ncbi:endonuclease VII domain-containing protein [Actinomadura rifamycini]|uniref:endonuclease VII domain-containing protein n=1 Tax=Actinomadura rifamycini TaxID=31962 RepID=UPI001FE0445A|nr:endonuclease VII domain-containing protein [Actinomadura rifamycini]
MISEKKCKDCGKVKAAAEFWKRKASPDGLALYCRDCFAQRNSASYRKKQASLGRKTKDFRRRREDPQGMKYCPRCETVKALEDFGNNRSKGSGNSSYCKPCWNTITREHRERRHGSSRNYLLKLRYGLTEEEVRQMTVQQGGVCVICLRAAAKHVDHDHFSGAVRRILCFKCNGALGQFEDDPQRMLLAADYLELRGSQARMLENEVGEPVFRRRTRVELRGLNRVAWGTLGGTSRAGHLHHRYGITESDADRLFELQVGLCGVCSDRPGEHIDHDHGTGAVRGIACTGCNTGMGQFGDDATCLRRAADYVMGELVRTVALPDGTTRLSFTRPDVDPATVPPNGWKPYRDADGERRRGDPSFGRRAGDGLTPLEVLVREIVARSGASGGSAVSGASARS